MSVLVMLNRVTIAELISDSGLNIDTTEVRKDMIFRKKVENNLKREEKKSLNEPPFVVDDMHLYMKLFKLTVGIIKEIWKANTDMIFYIPKCIEEKDYYLCCYLRKPEKLKRGGFKLYYKEGVIIYVDKKTFKVIDICWRNCKE